MKTWAGTSNLVPPNSRALCKLRWFCESEIRDGQIRLDAPARLLLSFDTMSRRSDASNALARSHAIQVRLALLSTSENWNLLDSSAFCRVAIAKSHAIGLAELPLLLLSHTFIHRFSFLSYSCYYTHTQIIDPIQWITYMCHDDEKVVLDHIKRQILCYTVKANNSGNSQHEISLEVFRQASASRLDGGTTSCVQK